MLSLTHTHIQHERSVKGDQNNTNWQVETNKGSRFGTPPKKNERAKELVIYFFSLVLNVTLLAI